MSKAALFTAEVRSVGNSERFVGEGLKSVRFLREGLRFMSEIVSEVRTVRFLREVLRFMSEIVSEMRTVRVRRV
ncbi:hypothetical protein PanWU01x14_124470 [Parasponia andersonii]|uniref:Uncharacterized protein n=1 Tax=Parasponia andersonii TaxID=3476 RepID=A0A2P5CTK1_PARAD|nr:hypothetical protein PanWU01x14_124470 [Parasponia andersonii]